MQAIAAVGGAWLIGESGTVERAVKPISGAVAGEDAAGAIAAVRRRGQTADEQARPRIAKARDRPPPIALACERRTRLARDLLAPRHKPRATAAARHFCRVTLERQDR